MNTQDHIKLRTKLLNKSIMGLMSQLEDISGKMMYDIDADLESRCIEAMDSKNPVIILRIMQELENRYEQF